MKSSKALLALFLRAAPSLVPARHHIAPTCKLLRASEVVSQQIRIVIDGWYMDEVATARVWQGLQSYPSTRSQRQKGDSRNVSGTT
jgi:hypothetical protein